MIGYYEIYVRDFEYGNLNSCTYFPHFEPSPKRTLVFSADGHNKARQYIFVLEEFKVGYIFTVVQQLTRQQT